MAGDRNALATIAGAAAAVSETSMALRTRTLGSFLIGFSIVFLHSCGASLIGADAGAVWNKTGTPT